MSLLACPTVQAADKGVSTASESSFRLAETSRLQTWMSILHCSHEPVDVDHPGEKETAHLSESLG